jgi:hypothetical protein
MVGDLLQNNSVFSLACLQVALGSFIAYFVSLHSVLKVVGEKIALSKITTISVITAIFITACRRFFPTPYNMLLFYGLMIGVVAFVFKLPLKKAIIGVVFALLLTMLSSVTITMNLLIHTNMRASAWNSFVGFLLMSLTEVFFNLVYVLLAMRYENLNLSFLFAEEENV